MSNLIIVGSGGHAVCIAAQANEQVLFMGDSETPTHTKAKPYLHIDELLRIMREDPTWNWRIVIGIGSNQARKNLDVRLKYVGFGEQYATLIDPRALVDERTTIRPGTMVLPGATINNAMFIGQHVLINTNAVVEHDNFVADYAHIGPNATLCGDVIVNEGAFIGAGSVVLPGIHVGRWATVGAGSVVTRNVPDGATVVGNPARPYEKGQ